jgi:integrase
LVSLPRESPLKHSLERRPIVCHPHNGRRCGYLALKMRIAYVLAQELMHARLGHTSIKTTEMYLEYLTPEEQQKVMLGRTA